MIDRLKAKKVALEKEAAEYKNKLEIYKELLDRTERKAAVIDEIIEEETAEDAEEENTEPTETFRNCETESNI